MLFCPGAGCDAASGPDLTQTSRAAVSCLQAVTQLLAHFEAYRDIPKIKELADKVDNLKSTLKSHVFSDFSRSADPSQNGPLCLACLGLYALH